LRLINSLVIFHLPVAKVYHLILFIVEILVQYKIILLRTKKKPSNWRTNLSLFEKKKKVYLLMLILRNFLDSIVIMSKSGTIKWKKLNSRWIWFDCVNELIYYVAWPEELLFEHEVERKFGWLLKSLFFGSALYAGYQFFPYIGIDRTTIDSFPATISSSKSLCLNLVVQAWQCC
jgi:hypothetical protein